jgi:hypothetical protein
MRRGTYSSIRAHLVWSPFGSSDVGNRPMLKLPRGSPCTIVDTKSGVSPFRDVRSIRPRRERIAANNRGPSLADGALPRMRVGGCDASSSRGEPLMAPLGYGRGADPLWRHRGSSRWGRRRRSRSLRRPARQVAQTRSRPRGRPRRDRRSGCGPLWRAHSPLGAHQCPRTSSSRDISYPSLAYRSVSHK